MTSSSSSSYSFSNRLESPIFPNQNQKASWKPDMRIATPSSPSRNVVVSARILYPQPTIDPSPTNSPTHPPSPRADDSLASDNESRLHRERTAEALREAMDGDLIFDARQRNPNTYAFQHKSSNTHLPRTFASNPMIPPPLLDFARQTTLPSASFIPILNLPKMPFDPRFNNIAYSTTSKSNVLVQSISPIRSSVDTLRSIQKRETHSSASNSAQPSWASNWWFQHKGVSHGP